MEGSEWKITSEVEEVLLVQTGSIRGTIGSEGVRYKRECDGMEVWYEAVNV